MICTEAPAVGTVPIPRILVLLIPLVRVHEFNLITRLDIEHLRVGCVVQVATATAHRVGLVSIVSRVRDGALWTLVIFIRVVVLMVRVGYIPR